MIVNLRSIFSGCNRSNKIIQYINVSYAFRSESTHTRISKSKDTLTMLIQNFSHPVLILLLTQHHFHLPARSEFKHATRTYLASEPKDTPPGIFTFPLRHSTTDLEYHHPKTEYLSMILHHWLAYVLLKWLLKLATYRPTPRLCHSVLREHVVDRFDEVTWWMELVF